MVSVGSVTVDVVPDAKRFNDLLAPQINQTGKRAGEKVGQEFTDSVQDKVKKSKPVELPAPNHKKSDAEIDKFLRDFNTKIKKQYQQSGDDGGNALAQGLRLSFLRNSPVIAAAVGGGLIAGAPVAIAGAGVLFSGIAAVAEKNNLQLQTSAKATGAAIGAVFSTAASTTVPMFTTALGRVTQAVQGLEPQLAAAFSSLGGPIDSLTTGVLALVQNAMPGLVAAVKNAGPVFAGLSSLLSEIGTGLGQFFQLVSQHAPAAGTALSSVGNILGTLLPAVGTLLGEGAELASDVLPPVAGALHIVGDALHIVAPVLPEVGAGLLGLAAARGLGSVLGNLAGGLESVGAKAMVSVAGLTGIEAAGLAAGTGFEAAAAGARGLETAMGPVGWIIAGVSAAVPLLTHFLGDQGDTAAKTSSAVQSYASALEQAKGAINQTTEAAAAKAAQDSGLLAVAQRLNIPLGQVTGAITNQGTALDQTRAALQKYIASHEMAVQGRGAQFGTQLDSEGKSAQNALDALNRLSGQTTTSQTKQKLLSQALQGTSTTMETLKSNLQLTADQASAANTQISLLKGALDALTGKTVSLGDAQVAVTQATSAALTALDGQKDSAGHLTSALVDANGAINLNTAAGAAAWQALTQLSSADNQLISTMEQQGATTAQVTAKDADLRNSFIQTAEKMGFSAGEAQNLADQIYGIPSSRTTEISADTSVASKAVSTFQQLVDGLHGTTVTVQVSADHTAGVILGSASEMSRAGFKVGYAMGGVIPGYAPGVDSVHAMLSPGEGVLVPEAVRGIGGAAGIQAINAAFSSRVPHFATGGVVDKTILANVMDNLLPVMQAVGAGLRSSSVPGVPATRAANEAAVQAVASAYGWGSGAQWADLVAVIMRESGFNNIAQNPTSTAYGMFQFLNSTWAGYPYPKTSNAYQQAVDGLLYVKNRYGSPAGALAHENAHGWYDQGGYLPPGPSLVYNGTGAPELVAPKQTFEQVMSGASGGSGPSQFVGKLYLDSGEFLGMVHGVAEQAIGANAAAADRSARRWQ